MPFSNEIPVAARASKLSRAQFQEVANALPHISFTPVFVETSGDLDLKTSLRSLGKSDFFTKEVDALLLSGVCRIAIHSAKDLPDPLPKGLALIALTAGVDPADALVLREGEALETLPSGARIGTSCERREKSVLALRSDLQCVDIRGTIERRLELLDTGEVDGVVMAEAALIRLGLTHRNRMRLEGETAPLQGKLAIVAREEDLEMRQLFQARRVLYLGTDPSNYSGEGHLIHYPVIRVQPRPIDREAFAQLVVYTHIIFTSKYSVQFFFAALKELSLELGNQEIIAIGESTAKYIREKGVEPLVAPDATQEGVIELLSRKDLKQAYVFLPRSSLARDLLPNFLQGAGVRYRLCDLYDTLPQKPEPVPNLDEVEEIVFTSPSTVRAFLDIFGSLPKNKILTPIGRITGSQICANSVDSEPH